MNEIEDTFMVEKIESNSEKEIGPAWVGIKENHDSKIIGDFGISPASRVRPVTSSESLIPLLVSMVDSAVEVVCVSTFLLQRSEFTDSLLRARGRGVRVYILTAGEEDLKLTDEDGSPASDRVREFRQLLSSISDRVFLRTADFHAKFVLVDPNSNKPKGFMTTCNLTADAMSGYNKELFVTLTDEEVYSFFCQFAEGIWKMSRHELKGGRLQELEEKRFVPETQIPLPTHPATLSSQKSLNEEIKKLITSARRSVEISAWTFTDEVDIPDLLMDRLSEGIKVKVYCRPNYLNGAVLSKLAAKGAKVLAHERFHAKMIAVDGERSLVTTANFAKHGLDDGFETGVLLRENDTKHLLRILSQWENECKWELSQSQKVKSISGTVKIIDFKLQEIREVVIEEEKIVNKPDIKLENVMREEELPFRTGIQESQADKIYRQLRYRYNVFQPHLPKDVSKVKDSKEKFDVFKLKSSEELFVPISLWDELDEARKLAMRINAKVVKNKKD